MFHGTDSTLQNISHIQTEYEEYFVEYCQSDKIFLKLSLDVKNIPHNTVSPAEHHYGSE